MPVNGNHPVAISVVAALFNEAESLPALHRRTTTVLDQIARLYELVLVDDGSTDTSALQLRELSRRDPRVRVLRLARNFGQHAALLAGLRHASGSVCVTIDADMQTPPEEIPQLLGRLAEGFDVVFGTFTDRHHPLLQRVTSAVGHALVERLLRMPRGVQFSPFRALSRPLVERLSACEDNPVQLEILLRRCAERMGTVVVRHDARSAGRTKYTIRRRLRFVLNLVRGLSEPRSVSRSPQYVVAERIGFPVDVTTDARCAS